MDVESIAFSKLKWEKEPLAQVIYTKAKVPTGSYTTIPMVMPLPEANLALTNREKAIIFKWIEQGAEWKEHWAFLTPKKQVPKVNANSIQIPLTNLLKRN